MRGRVPKEVTKERERIAWERRQQCWTEERIASEIGITQQAVSNILARVSKRVNDSLSDYVRHVKIEQTKQLWYICDESMQAWERSKLDAESETKKAIKNSEGGDANGRMEIQKRTEGQVGDPRFLAQAQKALEDIRKIWGVDAPIKQDTTNFGEVTVIHVGLKWADSDNAK